MKSGNFSRINGCRFNAAMIDIAGQKTGVASDFKMRWRKTGATDDQKPDGIHFVLYNGVGGKCCAEHNALDFFKGFAFQQVLCDSG